MPFVPMGIHGHDGLTLGLAEGWMLKSFGIRDTIRMETCILAFLTALAYDCGLLWLLGCMRWLEILFCLYSLVAFRGSLDGASRL